MRKYNIAGSSIAVIKNYRVVWSGSFGYRNKADHLKVTNSTLFNAASISKPITAIAVLIAFHDQSLSLNRNINAYLTAWKLPANDFTKNHPVTMNLLLSHTAGVTGFRCKGYSRNTKLPTFLQVLKGQPPANTPPVTVVRKPGSQYEYSPAGYMVIQEVLMNLYHQSFPTIMDKLVLKPLHMNRSVFGVNFSNKNTTNVALPYLPDGQLMPNAPLRFMSQAAGGLWTTADSLSKFIIAVELAQQGKSKVLSKDLAQQYFAPSLNNNMGAGIEINLNKYGEPVKQGMYFGHSGWNSGYISFMLGSKNGGDGIVILINSAPYMTYKGKVVQYNFIKRLVAHVANKQHW